MCVCVCVWKGSGFAIQICCTLKLGGNAFQWETAGSVKHQYGTVAMGQKLHSDAEHGKRLRDFPNARKNGNRACSAWMENFFSTPFMKMSDLSLPRLTRSVLNLISSSLHGVTKSQEEGRKKVGSETLWQRKMKARRTESVLHFCMTTRVELSLGLLL